MNQRNIKLNDKLLEVVLPEQLVNNPSLYDPEFTAVLFGAGVDVFGNTIPEFVLPFRNTSMASKQLPGIYGVTKDNFGCPIFQVIWPYNHIQTPTGRQLIFKPEYFTANNPMLDSSNVKQMSELIKLDAQYRQYENDVITAKGNVTVLKISPTNKPEMQGFKQAINDKRTDIDKYKFKLPLTWANDKRFLCKSDTITFTKLRSLGEAFGFKITLIIDNVSPDVANPIPHPISVVITGDDNTPPMTLTGVEDSSEEVDEYDDDMEEDVEYDF